MEGLRRTEYVGRVIFRNTYQIMSKRKNKVTIWEACPAVLMGWKRGDRCVCVKIRKLSDFC